MKSHPTQKIIQITRPLLTVLALMGAELFMSQTASAQSTFTWNGGSGTTGNWTDAVNWGGTAPASPQAFLNFNGSTRLSSTNNFSAGAAGYQIYFKSGAGAFNLYGNSISFFDFSSVDPNIQNEGSGTTQTVSLPIVNGNTHGANGILNINLNASPAQGPLVFNGSISNLDATIAVRALNVSGGSAVRFNGPLADFSSSGKLALTQLGSGTTTLTATNTFTGNVTVSAGTVQVAVGGLLGSGTYAGGIAVSNGATFEYSSTNAQTLSGVISGAGAVLLDSTNAITVTLSGTANTHSGVTTVSNLVRLSAGTANLSPNTTFNIVGGATGGGQVYLSTATSTVSNNFTISGVGYTDAVSINAGAIRMSAGQTLAGTITLAGNSRIGAITGSQSYSILGRITGGFGLDIFGVANANSAVQTFTFGNQGTANDYTGNTTLLNNYFNNGFFTNCQTILRLGASEQIPNGAGRGILVFGGTSANRNCVLELNGFNETLNGISGSGTWSIIQNTNTGASVLTIGDANTNSSFSGIIADGGAGKTLAIVKIGSGTLALSGTNTYLGGTTDSAGTLQVDNSSALGSGLLVMNGGALSNNVSSTLTNNINLAVASTVGVGTGQTLTLGGVITNTGALTMNGPGTLVLSNATSTYSGGITITNGTLSIKNVSGFGTGTITVNSGGSAYNFSSTSATITNAVILNGGNFHTGGGNAGTKNTWSGPVTITATSSMSSDGGTTGNAFTGGLNMGNSGYTFAVNGNGRNDGFNANNFNSVISGGPNATFQVASAGIAYLNAANTFSGTNRSGNSLVLQNVNALQNATLDMNAADNGSVSLINNAVIGALTGSRNLNLSVSSISIGNNSASTTFSGALTNTGSLIKIGSGTLTLSGANTYTGRTTVSSGSLALSGSGSLASSVIAVAGGATFDTSAGSFTLGVGQVLSNTASATAQLAGPLSSGSGTISVSFVNGTPSFNVTGGALTLSAATVVAVRNTGATLTPGTYKIISASGGGSVAGTTPTSVSVVNGPAAGTPSVSIVGGELYLTVGGASGISYSGTGPFTYDGAAHGPTANFSGSTGAQTSAYVGVSVSYGPSVNAPTNVGTYYLSNTVATDANYFGATNSQNFTIAAAALGITANNASKNYGQTVTFAGTEFTASGLVGSDSVSSVTLTSAGATNTAIVGTYSIVPSAASGTGLGNYTISYTNGTLTVNPASTSVGASSTMNPSGYQDAVSFIATLPADASGSVIFSSTNGPISTNTVSSGSTTSSSVTTLLRGTNVITVAYLGDSNYVGSTNSLNQVVTNHPPVASNVSYTRNAALNTFKIAVTNLLSNASDADGDTVSLVSVSATTNGATILIGGGYVMYYNTNAVADEFNYTVSDGFGGTNSATVTLNVDSTPLFGQSQIVSTSGGTATLNFAGIPGYSYSVSRSTNLVDWAAIWTTNAPAGGVFEFVDTSAPSPSAFYRLQYNP